MDPKLADRAAELRIFVRIIDRSRQHGVIVIDGEPGIGKTAFLSAAGRLAAERGWRSITGTARRWGNPPYGPLLDAIQEAQAPAGGRGTVLALDDLQWADDASARLVAGLIRRPPRAPLLVLLSSRSGRMPAAIEQAADAAPVPAVRMRLGPLDAAAVKQMYPCRPAHRRRVLLDASEGNPLYLRILADLPAPAVPEQAPAAESCLDETIAAELRGLPDELLAVARAAAVVGDPIDAATVAAVAEGPAGPAAIAAAMTALVQADVLRPAGQALRFRHPLVRAAAYQLSTPAWRPAAHRRAAEHLTAAGGPIEARARHIAGSAMPGDDAAARVLLAAARSTLGRDPATAAAWLRAWLRITRPDNAGTSRTAADGVRLLLARALWLAGEPGEASTVLSTATGTASSTASSTGSAMHPEAEVLLARCERALGGYAAGRLLTTEFTSQVGPDTAAAAELELAFADLVRKPREAAAARLAHRGADPAGAALRALAGLTDVIGPADRAAVHRAAGLFDGLADTELRDALDAVPAMGWAEHQLGLLDSALAQLNRAFDVALRYRHLHAVPELLLVRSAVATGQGRLVDAIQDADEVIDWVGRFGCADRLAFAGALKLQPLLWRHGPAQARRLLAGLPAITVPRGIWPGTLAAAARGDVLLQLGEPAAARRLIDGALSQTADDPDPQRASLLALAAVAALGCGDLTAASGLSERASLAAQLTGVDIELGNAAVAGARVQVACAAVDVAARSAGLAVEALHRVPVLAGQARLVAGEVAMAAGEHDAADRQFALAKRAFIATGARWLATVATNAQRRLGARRRGRANGDQLTHREREIADLICLGLSNKAIAERLVLSVRTVESHVASLFTKLGVTSRLAVARKLLVDRAH